MDFTQQDAETLGDKLDALDLTSGEQAALAAVFEAAAGDDVDGFAYDLNPNDLSFKLVLGDLKRKGFPTTRMGLPHEHQNP